MSAFLNALKADLLDRRLLPIFALLLAALAGSVAYGVLGGSSSTPTPSASVTLASPGPTGIAVSAAPVNPNASVAEMTSGVSHQRAGYARDPFTPLPGSVASTTPTTPTKPSLSKAATPETKGSTPASSGGSVPSTPSTPSAPTKPPMTRRLIRFHVDAELGVVPAGSVQVTPAPGAQPSAPAVTPPGVALTGYENLKLHQPLPSKVNPLVMFEGVVPRTGKSVVFKLVGEVIIRGNGTCLPNPAQCQEIELKPGQVEELSAVEANGTPVSYELKLLSIAKSATAKSAGASEAHARAARHHRLHKR